MRSRLAASVFALAAFISLVLLMSNVGNVYAASLSVMPSTVSQGSSFQVSGTGFSSNAKGDLDVYDVDTGACMGTFTGQTVSADVLGNFSVTLSSSGLTVGSHCVFVVLGSGGPTNTAQSTITVTSASIPTGYYPVGGVMLPNVGLTILLPWIIMSSLLGFVSVEVLIVKRRAKRT